MAAFQAGLEELREHDIELVAISTDGADTASETARDLGLQFPVGHSLALESTAAVLGTFYEERRAILHAAGFVLRPDASIVIAQYSSGAIGRLERGDVIRLVEFLRANERNRVEPD